jgi:hypothetical protein
VFTIANMDRELAQVEVAVLNLVLAAPNGHPLPKLKRPPISREPSYVGQFPCSADRSLTFAKRGSCPNKEAPYRR